MPKNNVKPISFRDQDKELYEYLCTQSNVSEYVRELIRRDMSSVSSDTLLLEIRNLVLELKSNGFVTQQTEEITESLYSEVLNLINFD